MTINVTSVNDAPTGADNTVTTLEDTATRSGPPTSASAIPTTAPANTSRGGQITTLPARAA